MGKKFVVSCSRPGMYRNGKQHEAAQTYDEKDWTEEQWAAFRADQAFTVTPLDEAVGKADTSEAIALLKKAHAEEIEKLKAEQGQLIETHGEKMRLKVETIEELKRQNADADALAKAKDGEIAKQAARIAELEKQLADQAKAKK